MGSRQDPIHSVSTTSPAQVSSVKDLFEFICSGPLIGKLGLTPDTVAESIDTWIEYGSRISKLFKLNELALTTPQKARIFHYYIPVFLWCEQQISDHRSKFKDGDDIPPIVVCLCLSSPFLHRFEFDGCLYICSWTWCIYQIQSFTDPIDQYHGN